MVEGVFLLELAGAWESRRLAKEEGGPQRPVPEVMVTRSGLEPTQQPSRVWKACPLCPRCGLLPCPMRWPGVGVGKETMPSDLSFAWEQVAGPAGNL